MDDFTVAHCFKPSLTVSCKVWAKHGMRSRSSRSSSSTLGALFCSRSCGSSSSLAQFFLFFIIRLEINFEARNDQVTECFDVAGSIVRNNPNQFLIDVVSSDNAFKVTAKIFTCMRPWRKKKASN